MHIMQMLWAFITEHWIISTLVGVPLIIVISRVLRTRMFIASTLREIYPEGLPQLERGQQVRDPKFSGKKFRYREMALYSAFTRKVLAPAVMKPIVIGRGKPKESPAFGKFHIHLGYASRGEHTYEAAKEVFGQERVWDGKTHACMGWGVPIFDDSGTIVAELEGDNLYFLVDPNLYGKFGGARVFAQVLSRAAFQITSGAAGETGDRFVDASESAIERSLAETAPRRKRATDETLEEPAETWQKLTEEARTAETESVRMRAQASAELGREYDLLCQVTKVTSVTVNEKNIEVRTDTLYCTDPSNGAVYEMGRFKILIPLSTSQSIIWKNETRQVTGYSEKMMALHISKNGRACLGNTGPWFKKLIGERKFADAAKLAIAFVETVNPEDTRTYKYIGKWPRVS